MGVKIQRNLFFVLSVILVCSLIFGIIRDRHTDSENKNIVAKLKERNENLKKTIGKLQKNISGLVEQQQRIREDYLRLEKTNREQREIIEKFAGANSEFTGSIDSIERIITEIEDIISEMEDNGGD